LREGRYDGPRRQGVQRWTGRWQHVMGVRYDQPDSDSAYGLSRLRRSGAKPC